MKINFAKAITSATRIIKRKNQKGGICNANLWISLRGLQQEVYSDHEYGRAWQGRSCLSGMQKQKGSSAAFHLHCQNQPQELKKSMIFPVSYFRRGPASEAWPCYIQGCFGSWPWSSSMESSINKPFHLSYKVLSDRTTIDERSFHKTFILW